MTVQLFCYFRSTSISISLCFGSLIDVARRAQKIVTIEHVNSILGQPHWRSHEALIKQQIL